jgi:hypothetical protein
MPATMTTVDALLKEVYGPRVENQLQNEVVLLKRLERTSSGITENVGGKNVDFPIKIKRNAGIGYRAEGGQLPAAGQQGYAEVHVPLRYGYGRVRFNNQIMDLAQNNTQAFTNTMQGETEGLKDDLAKDSGRVAYGDGSGLLCSLAEASTSATHTVDNPQYLEEDMKVDVLTKSNGSSSGGLVNTTIVSVNYETGVVVFGASFTSATTQGVYRTGNYGNEPSGLDAIVSETSTLHTVAPGTVSKWKGVVEDNGGTPRALSEGMMIAVCDKVRVNGGKTTAIFTSLGVRRAYFNLLTQQRRYTDTKSFAGGFTGLPFNYGTEIPVVEDVDHKPGSMHFIDEPKIKIYRTKKGWHWADEEGHVLKWVTDYDAFEGFMRQYWEIGTSQRNAHAALTDLIEG